MAKSKTKNRKVLVQIAEYLVSGGAYFWAGYLLFDYLYYVLDWNLWWSTLVSNVFGWTVNFILQRYWVFKNPRLKGKLSAVTVRYIVITLIDFALNYLILYQLRVWGITPAIGQFISAGFFTIWNYFWYKYWVFPARLPAPRHPAIRRTRMHR